MKTTVGEASKAAQSAEIIVKLLGSGSVNGPYFSPLTIKNGIDAIQKGEVTFGFADVSEALKNMCAFCKKLDSVEINVKQNISAVLQVSFNAPSKGQILPDRADLVIRMAIGSF